MVLRKQIIDKLSRLDVVGIVPRDWISVLHSLRILSGISIVLDVLELGASLVDEIITLFFVRVIDFVGSRYL